MGITHAEIPGVDLDSIAHVALDTHELGEDEGALLRALLRDHELHRSRVHTIAERRDHTKVGDRQERIELVLLDRLVAVPNVRQLAIARLPPNPQTPCLRDYRRRPSARVRHRLQREQVDHRATIRACRREGP